MAYSANKIKEALKHVLHPESGKDIVSLNMIEGVHVEDRKITLTLIFERPNDPFVDSIKKACEKAVLTYVDPDARIKGNILVKFRNAVAEKNNNLSSVKNIIAIASGKGGVGKSTIACNLAVSLAKKGFRTGLIDADIFGPSIPKMFHLEDARPEVAVINEKETILPVEKYDVKILSIGFFVEATNALIWRGPIASNALKQLINEADWGELDYLLIDLPPGTSDIHLTLIQTVPVTGVIIVSTPQDVALSDAIKGISMFTNQQINVPVIGIVENMAWFTPEELPENKYYIFGKDGCKKMAEQYNIPLLGQIPLVQSVCEDGDHGVPSALNENSPSGKAFTALRDSFISVLQQDKSKSINNQK